MSKKHKDDEQPEEQGEEMITRSFRLPKELMEWLDREAAQRRRKTNNYLEYLLAKLKARRQGEDRAG